MEVTKIIDGDSLTVKVFGRVDTVTSPELEKAINESIEGITHLKLDLGGLEYISSAGLRVILATSKKMSHQGELTLINVTKEVKDIFDMTGFSEILNIE